MNYKMEELVPIVAKLAQKYAGFDNSSITYEKAQMLMEAVIYCLKECEHSSQYGLVNNNLSVLDQYHMGAKLVFEKTCEVRKIFNEMTAYFDSYGVECLQDTVQKGIPEFLKWYDAKYNPQNTILTLDYPLLMDIHSLHGVDAVYQYLCTVKIEQTFLKRFEKNYVISILKKAVPDYRYMVENICSIVLLNTIGHVAIGKPFQDCGFLNEEYDKLSDMFSLHAVSDIENIVTLILEKMINQIYEDDEDMLSYLCLEVKNIAVRIDSAVKNKQLGKLFVL